ncbi:MULTISPECIES: Cys-tRNA(Pro) deacylase [Alteromonadaceae]|uniref:Cys-tRNA(Pro) deacylase n=1 Tax=Alteromonadaceae TaxID=72275 RepID=UPI001C0A45A6|nr:MULTISPECIES: Cys-tRNA(Pro) deacylase [Aliiglaciecola]MBU2876102.1 Cys-tRNA(Pro) deacylase [Aliiglaciecola lipolytica]MDO6712172.1 Cys-tRNA(Pro) deacylase [Aliiglaciecola sp. 2_MG-2023]MDO6754566.1 Cys-tRNA(Pro) deacylase [Aliiglaciecola sp. 1_MG-2023]
MTPAINLAKKRKIQYTVHQYQHDSDTKSFGLEAAEKLGLAQQQVFKTLVVEFDGKELAVAILPVNTSLSMKLMAKALSAKKVNMADKADVERATGYVLGGVSPLGQKKRLKTIIDDSAQRFSTIYVSAGRRGLEIELAADDIITLLNAKYAEIRQQ